MHLPHIKLNQSPVVDVSTTAEPDPVASSSVYDQDNFAGRVKFAAECISQGRESSRRFDTCFEMNDGDAVCLALFRRVKRNPSTKLAKNIWRYIVRELVERLERENEGCDLVKLSHALRNRK